MDNKLYAKIKKIIKDYVIPLLIFVAVFALFTVKLPWSIYAPGGLINVADRINSKEIGDNYFLTYVSFIDGTIPTLALAKILPSWDIISNDDIKMEDEDLIDANERDRIYLKESVSNAIYVAYTKNNYAVNIVKEHAYITYVFDKEDTLFRVGDELISYDDKNFVSFASLDDYIKTKSLGETIKVKVNRNDRIKTFDVKIRNIEGEAKLGISLSVVHEYDNNPNIEYTTKDSESGSSGGLMMTLAIYDVLANEDLARGRKISGTGTISEDGTVGEIGGIKYKLAGAVKKKADIFLAPTANYREALLEKEKNDYDIEIIEAKDIDQVISALRNY